MTRQDPYMLMWVTTAGGPQTTAHRTICHQNGGTKATWGTTFTFDVESFSTQYIYFRVMNENSVMSDKPIGKGSIPCNTIHPDESSEIWVPIFREDTGAPAGEIHLELTRLKRIVVECKTAR